MVHTSILDLGKDCNLQNITKLEFVEESVTESKLILLEAQQANKSRDDITEVSTSCTSVVMRDMMSPFFCLW